VLAIGLQLEGLMRRVDGHREVGPPPHDLDHVAYTLLPHDLLHLGGLALEREDGVENISKRVRGMGEKGVATMARPPQTGIWLADALHG
jgi:hypothetical protein